MTDKVSELLNFKTAPNDKCTAHSKRTGAPCNNPPVVGLTVCRMHGGATRAAKNAARRRIDEAAERMAKQLLRIADSADSEAVRLAAVKDALDRAGLKPPDKVDVEVGVKPYEAMLGNIVGMSTSTRSESRAARGISEPKQIGAGGTANSDEGVVIEGEVVDAETGPRTSPASSAAMRSDDDRGNGPGDEGFGAEEPPATRPGTGLMTMEEAMRLANESNRRAGSYRRR